MSDCPRCASLDEVIQTLSASEHELRSQNTALVRSLALAEKREQAAKAKLEDQHKNAGDAKLIYECLDVWEQCCWGGKGKPKSGHNGPRVARVRKALGWGFDATDICDAFRGLGLLPYREKYGSRSRTREPGYYRDSDVAVALGEEAKLERFRDYYRRVQALPSERLFEQWQQAAAVADQLFVLTCRARRVDLAPPVPLESGRPQLRLIEGEAA